MKIWLNDALVDASTVALSSDYWPEGFGVFETIKTVDGIPYALNRHMRRALDAGARVLISIPNEDRVRTAIDALLTEVKHPVGRLRLLFKQDGTFIAVHNINKQSDSAPHYDRVQPWVRINIPLINCEDSETIFYQDYDKSRIFLNPHNGTTAYIMEDESVLTKIDSVVLDSPTILRVSELHSVKIGPNTPRMSLTVGFDYPATDLLEEEKLEFFRSIKVCD
jgi:hypothetical protein